MRRMGPHQRYSAALLLAPLASTGVITGCHADGSALVGGTTEATTGTGVTSVADSTSGTNAGTNMFTNYDHLDKQDNPEPSATQQTTPFDDARTTASHHQGLPPQNYQPQPTTNQRGNKHDDSL